MVTSPTRWAAYATVGRLYLRAKNFFVVRTISKHGTTYEAGYEAAVLLFEIAKDSHIESPKDEFISKPVNAIDDEFYLEEEIFYSME
jgi:hypothetical protein